MAEDKGSDLDIFEGLTKKKKPASSGALPVPAPTMRGGLVPPPKKPPSSSLPLPKPPPKKKAAAGPSTPPPVSLPKPKLPPPSKTSRQMAPPPSKASGPALVPPPPPLKSDAPEVVVQAATMSDILDEPSSGILAGEAQPELDWDDEEEATSVFDRSEHELFDDLAARKPATRDRRDVSKAAALLAGSGRSAQPVKSMPPPTKPPQDSMPRIPAPAPIPRDISQSAAPAAEARDRHPSWTPQPEPRPAASGGGSKFALVAAVLAVGALLVGAYLYLTGTSAAPVEISVTHQGEKLSKTTVVNIYIDGQKKCEFVPCKLKLEPGKKQVRVVSGNLAGAQEIEVKGGKDHSFVIALGVSSDTAPPATAEPDASSAPPSREPGVVKMTTESTSDIKVSVNGKEAGTLKAGAPLELKELPAGTVKLHFEGGDDFGILDKEVELKAGQTLDIGAIKLPLLKVKTVFELATSGADVELIKEKDGSRSSEKLAFRGGKAEQTLDTSYSWTLKATSKGYQDFEQKLSFDDGKAEASVKIELTKETAVAAPTPPPPSTATNTTTQPPPPPPPPPPPAGGSGTINANSIPPSFVIIDGRPRGSTPVTGVKVSAGSHTVIFRHKTLGTKSRTVTVGSGQTKTAVVRFK